MNKKVISIIVGMILVVIVIYFTYANLWSYSALIKSNGFSKDDILSKETYSFDQSHLTHILLMSSGDNLALIGATKEDWGIWRANGLSSVMQSKPNQTYVTIGTSRLINWGKEAYSEKHIFVAAYVPNKEAIATTNSQSPFPLTIRYFEEQDKTILYAHAVAGKERRSFSTEDVLLQLGLLE